MDPVDSADPPAVPGNDVCVWGPKRGLSIGTVAVALAGIAWYFLAAAAEDRLVAIVIAAAAAVSTLALLALRRRLTAGPRGLLVRGVTGSQRLAWAQVHGIETVTRGRFGIANASIEVDADDDRLLVFGKLELGADPAAVSRELRRLWVAYR